MVAGSGSSSGTPAGVWGCGCARGGDNGGAGLVPSHPALTPAAAAPKLSPTFLPILLLLLPSSGLFVTSLGTRWWLCATPVPPRCRPAAGVRPCPPATSWGHQRCASAPLPRREPGRGDSPTPPWLCPLCRQGPAGLALSPLPGRWPPCPTSGSQSAQYGAELLRVPPRLLCPRCP